MFNGIKKNNSKFLYFKKKYWSAIYSKACILVHPCIHIVHEDGEFKKGINLVSPEARTSELMIPTETVFSNKPASVSTKRWEDENKSFYYIVNPKRVFILGKPSPVTPKPKQLKSKNISIYLNNWATERTNSSSASSKALCQALLLLWQVHKRMYPRCHHSLTVK